MPKTAAPPPKPLSKLAMTAYAVGLSPLGPLALPLGMWAWSRVRSAGHAGKPVAASAIALGVIWSAGLALLVGIFAGSNKVAFESAAVFTASVPPVGRPASGQNISKCFLRYSLCVEQPGGSTG